MSLRFALVATLLCSAQLASAQPIPQSAPDECVTTTTTTTRCTGSAAPLAVPPVEAPQAAPVFAPPPAYAPPVYQPPLVYPNYAPTMVVVPQHGWYLVRDADGSFWRERERSTPNNGLLGGGLGLFLSSWLITSIGGGSHGEGWAAWPVFGAMAGAIAHGFDHNDGLVTGLYALSTIVQATGFIMAMAGSSSGPKKRERIPLSVGPSLLPSGGGMSFSGRF